jgi:hypothetical protein
MTYSGIITRVERGRHGVTMFIDTEMGPRGVQVDRATWHEILQDSELEQGEALVGWTVEYDPAHGDLEICEPDDADDTDE